MRRVAAALLLVAASAAAAYAEDTKISVRDLKFAEKGPSLVATGAFTDVFDNEMLEQLSSGFVTTVLLRVYVYRMDQELPVWFSIATYRVSYDIWEEVYDVRIRDVAGERDSRYKTRADALKAVTTMNEMPVAPLSAVEIGVKHYVGIIVEVNPVSPELLAEVRKWLARPQGDVGPGAGSSFFGSFVSVFVNPKIEEADRILRIRTKPIVRVPR